MSLPATPIYMDYAATTPVDPRVAQEMARYLGLDGTFANPASRSHMLGWLAEQAVEGARRQVADLIHADPREIVWTSGATEADNLALIGFMRANRARGRHLITSCIEHKAILDTAASLEQEGFEVTLLSPDRNGRITPEQLSRALRPDTILVSLMAVNNETGSRNDIDALGRVAHEHGAAFHVDAAQAAGKIPLNVETQPIDLLSLSAHKVYGPKGIGALYVRRGTQVAPLIHGGGHERGMRSGTLPTHQIVGMGTAFALARAEREQDNRHIATLRTRLVAKLEGLPGLHFSIEEGYGVANILSVGFDDVDGQALLMEMRSLATASGSACNSADVAPSYVLKALGIPSSRALATLRLSLGRFSSEQDVDGAADIITTTLTRLRSIKSPA
ncbi:cysteine desulfurase family protein [Carnimonas nigrificans]|uniref:cysteine desulfurase family protein n=1 Tax=Carnimonas nigrificans TaxID=64323 RepID=UPI00047116E5|nr:aminotransferase class V-fold PLP-dependent enzyme [Carnimonas nigrificans]